ncbi:hypothetical protein [Bradyrhizobium paxllaeri]|uniref:hypothetical protein n=1 Tax=Bradyrhizobium paxllaeri TaxID=190148 RepID=UPI001146B73C|nr:hypothetical protein [Bradyrhizobium paxllaeri]
MVYYGDVRVGCIGRRTGNPVDTDPWQWSCGFYPGSSPGECTAGTAATFDQARNAFMAAWAVFLSKRTDADFEEWRRQRDWTTRKYAMWECGEKLPTQLPNTMMKCPCGRTFDSHDPGGSYVHREHIYAAQRTAAAG